MYLVKVVDKNSEIGLVQIHYVGYSNAYDEWRNKAEVVESNEASVEVSYEIVKPFSLDEQLCNRIKCALNSGRKDSPSVQTDMPFDKLLFDGGLAKITWYPCSKVSLQDQSLLRLKPSAWCKLAFSQSELQ